MVVDKVFVPKNPKKVACISRTTFDLLVGYGLQDSIYGAYDGTLNNPWLKLILGEKAKKLFHYKRILNKINKNYFFY